MKKLPIGYLVVLLSALLTLSGCEIIGDIFKAGVWVGIILVLVIVIVLVRLFSGGRRS
jgi:hypothetical protein